LNIYEPWFCETNPWPPGSLKLRNELVIQRPVNPVFAKRTPPKVVALLTQSGLRSSAPRYLFAKRTHFTPQIAVFREWSYYRFTSPTLQLCETNAILANATSGITKRTRAPAPLAFFVERTRARHGPSPEITKRTGRQQPWTPFCETNPTGAASRF
jgi:hypothetical protein